MNIVVTDRVLRDLQGLPASLYKKCRELMNELHRVDSAILRQRALPGWRLHNLRGSNMVSLSLDMNYRVLARLSGSTLILHRVVKHDLADRADVNRNDRAEAIVRLATNELRPDDIYDALLSFGVADTEAAHFRACSTENDLLDAATNVSDRTATLALTLYETSGLVIPEARFRVLQKDESLARVLETGGTEWEIYLHPSQAFLVELPSSVRVAVVGSAGTGKTVCAWHRTKHLIQAGVSVGFVCPARVSPRRIKETIAGHGWRRRSELLFCSEEPGRAYPAFRRRRAYRCRRGTGDSATWLVKLAEKSGSRIGLTLFYDLNQLGGNISDGDSSRYRHRIRDWKVMLTRFPQMQKFRLSINYRNAREITECYLDLLSEALPAKPLADVPVFESGDVVERKIRGEELNDVLSALLRRLLQDHSPRDIGIVTLDQKPHRVLSLLAARRFAVAEDPEGNAVVVTTASRIRGHERQVMIVISKNRRALCRILVSRSMPTLRCRGRSSDSLLLRHQPDDGFSSTGEAVPSR